MVIWFCYVGCFCLTSRARCAALINLGAVFSCLYFPIQQCYALLTINIKNRKNIMIIKLYHPDNTIKIIEDVSNVVVHMPMFSFSSVEEFNSEGFGIQDNHGISIHYPPYNEILDKNDNKCKFVDYISKDGFPMRLCVMELAYICNDHGKTIETVATKR